MSSKKVRVLRRPNYTKLPQELYDDSTRKIGAQLLSGTNGAVLRGLTPEEEEKYLPEILGVGANEPGFRKAKEDYWNEFSISVPATRKSTDGRGEEQGGVELEIGTTDSGEPYNLEDWIKWRTLLKHTEVANTVEEMEASDQYFYYISDPLAKQQKTIDEAALGRKAGREFYKLEDNLAKQAMLLRVLGVDTRYVPEPLIPVELENLVKKRPQDFLDKLADKNLDTKALIEELLAYEILNKQVNSTYHDDVLLGNSLDDTVKYLQNPANSKLLTTLKARLEVAQRTSK